MSKVDNIDPKMIANNITPFEPTHPGEILKDEIEYRGISQKKFAKEMQPAVFSGFCYQKIY